MSPDDNNENLTIIPVNSEVIVSEVCFTKRSFNKSKTHETLKFKKDKIDCLLKCKHCKLIVHQSKYLIFYLKNGLICIPHIIYVIRLKTPPKSLI